MEHKYTGEVDVIKGKKEMERAMKRHEHEEDCGMCGSCEHKTHEHKHKEKKHSESKKKALEKMKK